MRNQQAAWANLVIAHVWIAAGWMHGGVWPFAVGAVSLVVAYACFRADKMQESQEGQEARG